MQYKTILIDDEQLALTRLTRMLANYPEDFKIIGNAHNGEDGLLLVESLKPEVIFLDIEMPVFNGFELLKRLQFIPIVVFATAYEEYAIKAFEENSIDYLLKPIEQERLELTVKKLRRLYQSKEKINPISEQWIEQMIHLQPKPTMSSISIKKGDSIFLIKLDEVSYFEAEDKYVSVHTHEGKKHLIDYSLSTLEEKLPNFFVRISRSAIINSNYIKEIQKYFNGKYILVLNDPAKSKITSGSSYVEEVKKLFQF